MACRHSPLLQQVLHLYCMPVHHSGTTRAITNRIPSSSSVFCECCRTLHAPTQHDDDCHSLRSALVNSFFQASVLGWSTPQTWALGMLTWRSMSMARTSAWWPSSVSMGVLSSRLHTFTERSKDALQSSCVPPRNASPDTISLCPVKPCRHGMPHFQLCIRALLGHVPLDQLTKVLPVSLRRVSACTQASDATPCAT